MTPAASQIDPRIEAMPNPYESSRIDCRTLTSADSLENPNFFRWRAYFQAHLAMVVFMTAMSLADSGAWSADFLDSLWTSGFTRAINVFAMMLMLHNAYISPVIAIVLFAKGWNHGRRYAIAGIVELLLVGAFFFVAIPLVQ